MTCSFRGRCTEPATGVCTLCGQHVCDRHASRDFHFNVRPYAKGAAA